MNFFFEPLCACITQPLHLEREGGEDSAMDSVVVSSYEKRVSKSKTRNAPVVQAFATRAS
jgi:hypothetical protein